jgi:hypothetical protein
MNIQLIYLIILKCLQSYRQHVTAGDLIWAIHFIKIYFYYIKQSIISEGLFHSRVWMKVLQRDCQEVSRETQLNEHGSTDVLLLRLLPCPTKSYHNFHFCIPHNFRLLIILHLIFEPGCVIVSQWRRSLRHHWKANTFYFQRISDISMPVGNSNTYTIFLL